MPRYDISQIVSLLAARVDELVGELLPAAVREGDEWFIGSPAGEPGRSMAIRRSGAKAGVWSDFASGDRGGDALELVTKCLGRTKADAVEWSLAWLGLDGCNPDALRQTRRAQHVADRIGAAREQEDAAQRERRRRLATATWLAGRPLAQGDPVDRYMLARGIDLRRLGRTPAALRFHPELIDGKTGEVSPGMVAAVVLPSGGGMIAVHRTFLAVHDGIVSPRAEAKRVLGSYGGGVVMVWRGRTGKRLREAPPGETVLISEGIEDALTLALACPDMRVVSGISVGNFRQIRWPQNITRVIVAADADAPGSKAERAVGLAMQKWVDEGVAVSVSMPPAGAGCKDFNDMLRRSQGNEGKQRDAG